MTLDQRLERGRALAARQLARTGLCWLGALVLVTAGGCGDVNGALEQLAEAHKVTASLHLHFTQAADAASRAVMADTDQASVAFARESEQATQAAQAEVEALRPMLQRLGYTEEAARLAEFEGRFATFRALDRTILELAVENTNLKARQLSFGPAQEAMDAFRDAMAAVAPASPANRWQVEALGQRALAAAREIQLLEGPHIAEAGDAGMRQMEGRMASAETSVRDALHAVAGLAAPASRSRLDAATAAFDRFMELHRQILALSHRNTNVRSLALSLDEKRPLTQACEESLRALEAALAKRGYTGTR